MDISDRILFLLAYGCLAIAQAFQSAWRPDYPVAPPRRTFQVLQRRPMQLPKERPNPTPVQRPARFQQQKPNQKPLLHQSKERFEQPLIWRFPEDPIKQVSLSPQPEEHRPPPLPAHSVTVVCGRRAVRVEARMDLLGIGQPIQTADLTLGGCPPTVEDSSSQVVIFESELHGCGSTLTVTEDELVYSFTLHYNPTTLGSSSIVRTREVAIGVQCHYQRKHAVSSEALKPTWEPFDETKVAEEHLYFSLKLMADDWKAEMPNGQYFLGDMMKFEASVQQFYHMPLRVYVENCVATVIPNTDTVPRYAFLANHGCFMDARYTGLSSQFMPRTQDNKLQFQMEAFKFINQNTDSIYITCWLKATTASAAITAQNKACSFSSRWTEASGGHAACGCCDTEACGSGRRDQHLGQSTQWGQETSIGPIKVKDKWRLS